MKLQVEEPSTPKTTSTKKVDSKKMWVNVRATSDNVEINMDKPSNFPSVEAEVEWERRTAKNAMKFKDLIENGQMLPDEIRKKLQDKSDRTPEENEILMNETLLSNKREKVQFNSPPPRGRDAPPPVIHDLVHVSYLIVSKQYRSDQSGAHIYFQLPYFGF